MKHGWTYSTETKPRVWQRSERRDASLGRSEPEEPAGHRERGKLLHIQLIPLYYPKDDAITPPKNALVLLGDCAPV